MRLALCNATRRWGGVKTWTIEFAASLRERGHSVFLYGREGNFTERAAALGLPATGVHFGCDFNPFAVAWFCREFRRLGIEAVMVNVGKDLRTAGIAARLCGIPLAQRIGLPGDMKNSLQVKLLHKLARPRYLCPCRYIRDGLLSNLPFIRPEETSVVYSAKRPRATAPTDVHAPLRIVSTSQVNPNKGHAELARTLAALKQEGLPFTWEIAGEGSSLENLRHLCNALGLGERTRFHGFLQNVSALLEECDLFVLSSYTEGLPNTLLEAMANGLIPVARAVGGVAECWPPDLAPFLVPYAGWESQTDWREREGASLPLYTALKTALTASAETCLDWKRRAWEHCSAHFSLPAQTILLETFFRDMANHPQRVQAQ